MGYNFKGYLNIIHSGKKVNMPKSFRRASLMKDYLNDEVPNGTPKTLIPFNGVLN
jgi:hypothetical protein